MQHGKQHIVLKKQILLTLMVGVLFLITACTGNKSYQRSISFGAGWAQKEGVSLAASNMVYCKKFDFNFENDRLYMLAFDKADQIVSLQLNHHALTVGTFPNGVKYFNLTQFLNQNGKDNLIELVYNHQKQNEVCQLQSSRILCLNKLFIPSIKVNNADLKNVSVDVVVRNLYDNEKQGSLQYMFINGNDDIIKQVNVPVFLNGNTENLYQQNIPVMQTKNSQHNITLLCKLFVKDKLMDEQKIAFE